MSRLYYTEEGRVIPSLCEELSRHRRVRKHLDLPATEADAQLWLLVRCHPGNDRPLRVVVNGAEVDTLKAPFGPGAYRWVRVDVEVRHLRAGDNVVELWTETDAFDGWSLALEAGRAVPGSEVSDDAGASWRRERMGYLNAVLAEYVVRVRLAEGEDPPPAPVVFEDRSHPRLAALRERLPAAGRADAPVLERARALSSWLAGSWEHTSSGRAEQYAPWDIDTLLSWAPAQRGHNGKRPIAMCVHYAAAFVSAAQAVGIPARCAVTTEAVNGSQGHFVAEVWEPGRSKWVVVDPNSDALFLRDGVPLSMSEVQAEGEALGARIEYGPGTEFQRTFPHMVEFCEGNLEKGVCFRHRSVWHRADLLSRPWHSPPGHGSLSYCETGLVWERRDLGQRAGGQQAGGGFGMFPCFGDPEWFDAPPEGWAA